MIRGLIASIGLLALGAWAVFGDHIAWKIRQSKRGSGWWL